MRGNLLQLLSICFQFTYSLCLLENRIGKMLNFELGKEIAKEVFL